MFYQRLQKGLKNCGELPPSQFGFQRGFSTMQAASHLKEAIKMNVTQCGRNFFIMKRHLNLFREIFYEKAF